MTKNPGRQSAEKYLQQVCSLGLQWQQVMPTILETLHDIVPSYGNTFLAANPHGDVVDIYDESPDAPSILPVYADSFLNRKEREVFVGWRNAGDFRSAVDFDRLMTVDRPRFLRHAFYHEVLKPVGFFYGAHVALREGSELRGYVQFKRNKRGGRYARAELRRIDWAARFINHALAPVARQGDGTLYSPDVSKQGLIIADARGRIQHLSSTARRLISLSCLSPVSKLRRSLESVEGSQLPDALASLCATASAIANDALVAEPPSRVLRNAWGEFHFHAYMLEPSCNEVSDPLVGISVTWFKPIAAKVLGAVKPYGLSMRQIQTCVLLAMGLSAGEIAGRLGVRESTVVSHRKEIYNRVGVNNRAELLGRLVSA